MLTGHARGSVGNPKIKESASSSMGHGRVNIVRTTHAPIVLQFERFGGYRVRIDA